MKTKFQDLKDKSLKIVESFGENCAQLRVKLNDPNEFKKTIKEQEDAIINLEEAITNMLVTLPDGRKLLSTEYKALERLAKDNGLNTETFEDHTIIIEDYEIVTAQFQLNSLKNIDAISELTNLKSLVIYGNEIKNISALSSLIKLEKLYLSNNQIEDISALSGLYNLNKLVLSHNLIKDVTPLSKLINLEELSLEGNPIPESQRQTIIERGFPIYDR